MGYICPDCGEGLPANTPCPCAMGPDDEEELARVSGPLTAEIDSLRSPVRQFLSERFAGGLRDLQRRYRQGAPPLAVPSVARGQANPGTVGTAADWLLRFLVHPRPSLTLARVGALFCHITETEPDMNTLDLLGSDGGMLAPLCGVALSLGLAPSEVAAALGLARDGARSADGFGFTGPVQGSAADPEHLARACWVLALFTEVYRAGWTAAARGPLGQFRGRRPSAAQVLDLAPPAALSQLAAFRDVFETTLLPKLANLPGPWWLGPVFTGSSLIAADADLIAAGLLLELKTSATLTLSLQDVFQIIGYALLDFDDRYSLVEAGIFSARYAYLATWDLATLLSDLAGHPVSLQAIRQDFRHMLLTHR